jgi:hypothetical protein
MPTVKEEIKNFIDELPDDATLDDIEYQLYVRRKIALSQEAVTEGKYIIHEEAVKQFREWSNP